MTKLREHRGTLSQSMETVIEFEGREELYKIIKEELGRYSMNIWPEMIEVKPYGYDERIEWDTYIVTVDGYGVYGFTDGPV